MLGWSAQEIWVKHPKNTANAKGLGVQLTHADGQSSGKVSSLRPGAASLVGGRRRTVNADQPSPTQRH